MPQNLVSVFTNCYGRFGVAAAIEHVPQLGLRHIELALKAHGGELVVPESVVASTSMGAEGIRRLQEHMAAHGVTAASGNGTGEVRTRSGVESVKARLDLCHALGIPIMVGSAGEATDEDRPALYQNLLELGDYARERGIIIAFETHPGITVNADEMLRTMRDLSHPNLRINFDTANIYFYNDGTDGEEELRRVAPYVASLHLKDSRGGYREWYFPALGDGGRVSFATIGKIMNDVGFYGPFTIELEGIKGEPELTLEQRQERLQRSVDHLRAVGFLSA